jgi:23S rRNA pseudouridine2605 synthase
MLQGRVRVNGEVASTLGVRVIPGRDQVILDGKPVATGAVRWVLFHKPRGALTTRTDPQGRKTVYEILPEEVRELRYVGRLDQDTEGLLLLTNDGDVLHGLTHPSNEVEREYEAWVDGVPSKAGLKRLQEGIVLEDGPARAARAKMVRRTKEGGLVVVVLTEGRKREVRRLLEAVGHPVLRLRRTRFGPIRLKGLESGQWRELNSNEIRALREAARS